MSRISRLIATCIALAAGLAGVIVILHVWNLPPFRGSLQTTNDAYVRGQVTLLSPQLSGYLVEVPVRDYQLVKRGDLIARIDDRIYAEKLEQARATVASAEADLANSEQSRRSAEARIASARATLEAATATLDAADTAYRRTTSLVAKNYASRSEEDKARVSFDQAQASLHQAEAALLVAQQDLNTIVVGRRSLEAKVQSAEAAVKLAEIDVANTRIVAPQDGTLGEVTARLGQYVSAGTQIGSVVPRHVWVVANFKETQLSGMRVGLKVDFTVDALGDQRFTGTIQRFAPATGSEFAVIKSDNATGNFTKVAQRIPVMIDVDPDQPSIEKLVPGLSVVATVDLKQAGATSGI